MTSASPLGVIFDLDGTLLDTLGDLTDSGNVVLAARGFPQHDEEAYRHFVGSGMEQLVHDIFPPGHGPRDEEEVQVVLKEYRDAYQERWQNRTQVYSGIAELLDQLQRMGIPMGVVSNKAHDFTLLCVEAFLSRWQWTAVLGQREGIERKPDPAGAWEAAGLLGVEPERCCFVGDTEIDLETAINAKMIPVGVSWGFRDVEVLRRAGAKVMIDHPGELLALFDRDGTAAG